MKTPKKPPKKPVPLPQKGGAIVPMLAKAEELLPASKQESLVAWFNLYMGLEARASADNTFQAKKRDLEAFLLFFRQASGSDHPDQWTRPITADFLKFLDRKEKKQPTTIDRILATLRRCAAWIHKLRPFLAGNPCHRIADLKLDDPEWKSLSDIEVTRLRSAAEQLLHLKKGKNQHAIRDYALFIVLLHMGLRVSELLALDLDQHKGKHFVNVKRKSKKVSRQVFLSTEAREALTRYLEVRCKKPGPLFASRSGERLGRQNVHDILRQIAAQANTRRPEDEKIHLSAHVLRHSLLRRAAQQ